MRIDGSSNVNESGVGIIRESSTGEKISYALRLEFLTSNNEAEYEALLVGLQLAEEMRVEQLRIYSDSQLVVNQINKDYQAKGENMAAYLKIAGRHLRTFKWLRIGQVPKTENVEADSLVRLVYGLEDGALGQAPIEILAKPNTKESADHVMSVDPSPSWIDSIFKFLVEEKTLEDKNEARRIKYQANRYTILNEKLYRRGYVRPYLICLRPDIKPIGKRSLA